MQNCIPNVRSQMASPPAPQLTARPPPPLTGDVGRLEALVEVCPFTVPPVSFEGGPNPLMQSPYMCPSNYLFTPPPSSHPAPCLPARGTMYIRGGGGRTKGMQCVGKTFIFPPLTVAQILTPLFSRNVISLLFTPPPQAQRSGGVLHWSVKESNRPLH